jgi:hypothetical protein
MIEEVAVGRRSYQWLTSETIASVRPVADAKAGFRGDVESALAGAVP